VFVHEAFGTGEGAVEKRSGQRLDLKKVGQSAPISTFTWAATLRASGLST
jgi:hypothetical protein